MDQTPEIGPYVAAVEHTWAGAIFGNPNALEVVPVTAAERGPTIQAGEIDILSRNVTWTSARDAQWGNYTVTMFYDG